MGTMVLTRSTWPLNLPLTVKEFSSDHRIRESLHCVAFAMCGQLGGVLLLLVALVATVSGQYNDPLTRMDGHPSYLKNRKPSYDVRRLVGRQYSSYGQSPRNVLANHLDVALPMSILNSDGSLLLHLKDREVWEKENSERGQNLKAALMPSYLKSLEHSESPEESVVPTEPDDSAPQAADPKKLLSKLFEHFNQDPDMTDVSEENLEEIIDEAEPDDKEGLTLNLREAFKRFFEKHFPLTNDEGTNYRRKAMKSPGVFFNLKDMEKHFEEMYESMHSDNGLLDFVQKDDQGGVSFNIGDIIKEEQVLEKEKANSKELKENTSDEIEEMDLNQKLAEGLRRNNIPVKTGTDGGLFFNLNRTQN